MLIESRVSQPAGEPRRRWFSDGDLDLIVWLDPDGAVRGFQLCYERRTMERAVKWTADSEWSHGRIDDGGESPVKNRAPIVLPDGAQDIEAVAGRFRAAAAQVDPPLRDFVLARFAAWPRA